MARVASCGDRECPICGVVFPQKGPNHRICSQECKDVIAARAKAKLEEERAKSRIVPPAPPQGLAERPADMDAPVKYERDEWSEAQVRKHFHLDGREPAKYRARSLAECEVLQRMQR